MKKVSVYVIAGLACFVMPSRVVSPVEAQSPPIVRNLTGEIRTVWKRKARDLERIQLLPKRSRSSEDEHQPSPFEMYAAHRALASGDYMIEKLTDAYMNARQRTTSALQNARESFPSSATDRLQISLGRVLKESYDIRLPVEKSNSFVEMQNIYEAAMTGLALLPTRTRLLISALRDLYALNEAFRKEGKPAGTLTPVLNQRLDEAFSLFEEKWTVPDALLAEARINTYAQSLARISYKFLEEVGK